MEGERAASAKPHADNIAPSMMGGFTIIRGYDPLDVFQIPYPEDLRVVVIYPHIEIKTADARRILKSQIKLSEAVTQWGNVAGLVSGLMLKDYELISRSLKDVIIEPIRSILIPHYDEIRGLCMEMGAMGFNISGSGPTMFAMTRDEQTAEEISTAAARFLNTSGIDNTIFHSVISPEGAKVV